MQLFITFGQVHRHEIDGLVFDKDCVAVIDCETYGEGREKAFKAFGPQFCLTYDKLPPMHHFPRGLIEVPQWD